MVCGSALTPKDLDYEITLTQQSAPLCLDVPTVQYDAVFFTQFSQKLIVNMHGQ